MVIQPNQFIKKLEAYKVTPQEPWLSDNDDFLKLDWNEGSEPPDFLKNLIIHLLKKPKYWSWYPDYNSQKLNLEISKRNSMSDLQHLTFPGSDVALDTICRTFISPGDSVYVLLPTYTNFFTFAESCGADINKIFLEKPYIFNADLLLSHIPANKAKLIYLVSPNNPCGYEISKQDLMKICRIYKNSLIICDQAYVEFSIKSDLKELINIFDNLIITRTFSKAYSLAGIRIGYCIGQHSLLKEIQKIRNGKNITMLSQEVALACLKNNNWLENRVLMIRNEKEILYSEFINLGITFYKSSGNFVLFEPKEPNQILSELKANGIFIRDQIKATKGGLRVTITSKSANRKFINILKKIYKKKNNT